MKNILLLYILLFVNFVALTQGLRPDRTFVNSFYDAEAFLYEHNYDEALNLFLELETMEPENANIWYKIGVCYLNTKLYKSKAKDYLEKASEHIRPNYKADNHREKNAPLGTLLYLGQAYRLNYDFDRSLETFNNLIDKLNANNENDKQLIRKIEREIRITNNAIDFSKKTVDVKFRNLGLKINTKYSEHSPLIDMNETMLVFTSRRPRPQQEQKNQDEDIFISRKINNVWQEPVRPGAPINTEEYNEIAVALSMDGRQIIFLRSGNGNTNGNLYITSSEDRINWSTPRLLDQINSQYKETQACFSPDGNSIYFTSNRTGGVGGTDIYVTRRSSDGTWSSPQMLSAMVNTPYNETSPFMHPDGVTLFFSSEGHNSMGGYDVFYTKMDEYGHFSKPVNLGYPINTTDDEINYVINIDGRKGYMAAVRDDGHGDFDIYEIIQKGIYENEFIVYEGIVSDLDKRIIKDVVITVTDITDEDTDDDIQTMKGIYRFQYGEVVAEPLERPRILPIKMDYIPNDITGKYTLVLPPDKKYEIIYELDGHIIDSRLHLTTSKDLQTYSYSLDPIDMEPVVFRPLLSKDLAYSYVDDTELKINADARAETEARLKAEEDAKRRTETETRLKAEEDVKRRAETEVRLKAEEDTKRRAEEEARLRAETRTKPVGDIVEIENVLFYFDSYNINPHYYDNLNRLAKYLNDNPDAVIEIGGHTDWIGPSKYNYLLSYKRAKAIKDYLVEKGTNPANIITEKYGETKPIVSNITREGRDNPKGRKYNRRGEFKVLEQGSKGLMSVKPIEVKEDFEYFDIYDDGDIWTVQIFALRNQRAVNYFSDLIGVKMHISDNGWYRYYVGEFNSSIEARQHVNTLREMGYDPFIRRLSYFQTGRPDKLKDDPKYSDKYYDRDGIWTVQIFALENRRPVDYFKNLSGVKLHVSSDGLHRYYLGEFNGSNQARQYVNTLQNMGYDSFIRKISFFEK